MPARERQCKWFFSPHPQGSREDGPNNPLEQSFKRHPYASLIRESIQNSLDAVLDPTKPVVVKYSFLEMNGVDYPSFFEVQEHIQGCLDYYPENTNARQTYKPMLKWFEGANKYHQKIGYIRVSDYNTTGMDYREDDTNNPFYAFVRSAGVSAKDNAQAGGSFGFGKAAYFLLSPISTIVVSTCTKDYKKVFEGISSLCTHTFRGEKKMAVGYYDDERNQGVPVSNEEDIPTQFKREEPGTDISIIGFEKKYKDEAVQEMAESVLRNFWMAILNGRLSVVIDETIVIEKSNIEKMMEEYFPDESDNTRKGGYDNPRPYFDAVRLTGTSSQYPSYKEKIPLLGNCILYLNKQKGANDKISYLRELQMLIFSKRTKTNYGTYGVFYCDDKDGNEILRHLENSAHNEWKSANWTTGGRKVSTGNSALKALDEFVNRSLSSMFAAKSKVAINIKGLEEFLYIPTQYEDDEDLDSESLVGQETGIFKPEDGASYTTDIPDTVDNPTIRQPKNCSSTGQVVINRTDNATASSSGNMHSGHSDKPRNTSGEGIKKPASNQETNEHDDNGERGVYATPITLPYRTFSQNENGLVYHYVVLHSEEEISNIRLHFYAVGEDGEDELFIAETSEGTINGAVVGNICLSATRRKRIRIRFTDKMKHTIKLEAEGLYEV